MRFDLLTIFPEFFAGPFDFGIIKRARQQGIVEIIIHDLRSFTFDKHHVVDDRPFGGGDGMVLKPEPIFDAVEDVERRHGPFHRILLCPRGRTFTQARARELATMDRLMFLCGRYEGLDERIRTGMAWEEISLGDFVLAGGELAALAIVEASVRLIPGVLGCEQSPVLESFEGDLLDWPQFTRPRSYRGMDVPEVLMSGDHGAVARWRTQQAAILTARKQHGPENDPGSAPPSGGAGARQH